MLEELNIAGLGVIDRAAAEFGAGFTVLTGETGAGKTMILSSLHLLSGARADAGRVRTGAQRATVEGRFRLPDRDVGDGADRADGVAELLDSTGAEPDEDGSVIAVRTVGADGRSRAHLGGRSVPVGVLGRFTSAQLTIHGQNDQLRLIRAEHQRGALDRFGGTTITSRLAAYRSANATWRAAADLLAQRRSASRERAQELDRLRFALDEISSVDPQPGEDVELAASIRRLSDLESLRSAAAQAHALLAGADDLSADDDVSVVDGLGRARSLLETVDDDALSGLAPRISDALGVVTDLAGELGEFLSSLPVDASELEKLLVRQAELKALVRKYAPDVDGVIAWRDDATARVAELEDPGESLEKLEADESAARDAVTAAAAKLSSARVKAAARLSSAVSAELSGLAMGDASITVTVSPDVATAEDTRALDIGGTSCRAGEYGVDRVEFGLTAHRGAAPLPLAKSASGGELSRVMLALEVVLAADDTQTTMVFDEIDAGVGGQAAVQIGKRLAALARRHQVIVVTHLPQVAAFADHHLMIGKQSAGRAARAATSTVTALDSEERVAELARMLAGLGDSETGRAHAEELLATAQSEKTAQSDKS